VIIAGGVDKFVHTTAGSGADALRDPTLQSVDFFADEELPLLDQGAEALAFPSLAEGFGLPDTRVYGLRYTGDRLGHYGHAGDGRRRRAPGSTAGSGGLG
jgi:hypothetical protein